MKFKLKKGKGSVSGFTDAQGVTHLPGDIVDLPPSYEGEAWLERVEPEKKQKPMVEAKAEEAKPAPFGKEKKSKS